MTDTKKKRKYTRLTPAQWETIVVLWELGKVTIAELSDMYPITEEGLRIGLKKRGAKKGSRAHEVGEAVVEASKADAQKRLEDIDKLKKQYIGYTDVVIKLTMREVSEALKAGVPVSTRKESLTALQKASAVISTLRREAYELYGLNDENAINEELPDLAITEYTPEELEKIRRGFEVIDDDDEEDEFAELDALDVDLPFDDEGEDQEGTD
tara:strand:- start:919 stop:1551 length:633 start_codon:yes stop_codon:yes gene_type:complete